MKKEEDILIYQSWWKNTITGLFLIILAVMSIYGYIIGKIPVWTLIAAISFGICGLILLYIFVKQQLKHAPIRKECSNARWRKQAKLDASSGNSMRRLLAPKKEYPPQD